MQATPTTAPARRFQALSALRHRNYRLYWFGLLSAVMGLQILWVGQAWLVYDLTHSPLFLGLVGFSQALPAILLNMVGGVVADRLDRRKLLIVTQSVNSLIVLVLAVLVAIHQIEVWHLITAAVAAGAVGAFDQPSRMAFAPQLIPPEDLLNAIAMQQMIWQGSRVIGPAIGGLLIALVGVEACFFLTAAAVGGMVLCIAAIKLEQRTGSQPRGRHLGHDLAEGVAFIKASPVVTGLIGMTFFNSIFGLSHEVLLPIFARDVYQVGSEGYGSLIGISGIGAVVATVVIAMLGNYPHKGRLLLPGAVGFGLSLIAFALSPSFLLSMGIMFVAGLLNSFYMTTASASVQMIVPNQLRGRVMGVYGLTWSMLPLGGMVMGSLASLWSAPAAVVVGGMMVAGMALVLAATLPALRSLTPSLAGSGSAV